ncbi:MAG: LytTR family transcriptional regulator [Lachnospiraceae bacterium]|nr:LytTR family transcriptional regulator [Lachnospiraceae bacterium]
MKIKIEIEPSIDECEVTIKCPEVNQSVLELQKLLSNTGKLGLQISFFKGDAEYFFPVSNVLFFETSDGCIRAHTVKDEFEVHYKLYELEEMLPAYFMRISKSTILNTHKVYSITKNLTGASKVEFGGTHKTVYCSRNYYKALKENMRP